MPTKRRQTLSRSVRELKKVTKPKTWILVAERTRAKLLSYSGKGNALVQVSGYVNPSGELQTRELTSDRPGRGYARSIGTRRTAMTPSEDKHEQAFSAFAKSLAAKIEKGLANRNCEQVILVAEPHCLGKIKNSLGSRAKSRIRASINKDLFRLDEKKLFLELKEKL